MFRKSPMATGWIVAFLMLPVIFLVWELAYGTYNNPARHGEHLLLLLLFIRGLFEVYGYMKRRNAGELG